jgi:uncharacterized membrane-anchored protein YjiN (DUF445 family)
VSDPPSGSRVASLPPPLAPPPPAVVPIGSLVLTAAGDAAKLRALRRMKLVALGLFLAAAAVFVVALLYEDDHAWVGYVRATAEAAMVGALADWFAVTALFRHPLGLPIPHTAIIAKRKDEIGRSLGEFVQGNFLTREVIATRLASVHVSQRLGRWLAERSNAERAGAAVADALGGVVEVLDDRDVQDALGSAVERRLRATEVAPLLGRALDVAIEGGHHQRMLESAMKGVAGFLDENRTTFRERLEQESPWWIPESIDDRVFQKIFNGVQRFLADVAADRNHEVRRSVDTRVAALAAKLRHDPVLMAKCESMKLELLDHPEVQAWLQSLWSELKRSMLAAAGDPDSELRRRLDDGLARAGARLATDVDLQAKIDDWVERLAGHVVENYKGEVADIISSTVERWDAADTSRRIELQVGRDLQFIRINGTIVGGLAGLAIYTVSQLIT